MALSASLMHDTLRELEAGTAVSDGENIHAFIFTRLYFCVIRKSAAYKINKNLRAILKPRRAFFSVSVGRDENGELVLFYGARVICDDKEVYKT